MIEPAVGLGVKQPVDQWPPIKRYEDLAKEKLPEPEVLIEGMLHQGGKLLLGGGSKAFKSWSLIDLSLSLHTGTDWWGNKCRKSRVLFINFEIQEWSFRNRLSDVIKAKNLTSEQVKDFDVWTLRGYAADLTFIRPIIEKHIQGRGYQAIVLDPNYMLMGDRDENSAGDMASLMNELEALATKHKLSVILSHHFAKGNASSKEAIDRFSGSGVFARNPDSLVVLTPHEEDERTFTCDVTLRNFSPMDPFVIQWHYPLFRPNYALNPDNLKRPGAKPVIGDERFLGEMGCKGWQASDLCRHIMDKCKISERTFYRHLKRLTKAGKILLEKDLYTANQSSF
jgi:DNA-binding transcriptional ArsR family regulator